MPHDVILNPEGGGTIIHFSRGPRPIKCFYCGDRGALLCDFILPATGKTCDRPMCAKHTTKGKEPKTDFCREHQTLNRSKQR